MKIFIILIHLFCPFCQSANLSANWQIGQPICKLRQPISFYNMTVSNVHIYETSGLRLLGQSRSLFDLNRKKSNYNTQNIHKSWILQILQRYIRHTVQPSKFRYRLENNNTVRVIKQISMIHWICPFRFCPAVPFINHFSGISPITA